MSPGTPRTPLLEEVDMSPGRGKIIGPDGRRMNRLDTAYTVRDLRRSEQVFREFSLWQWPPGRHHAVLIACMCCALLGGSPNAFQTSGVSGKVETNLGLLPAQMSAIGSLGLVGLYLTYPAGWLNDKVGALANMLLGAVFAGAGYIIMSLGRGSTWGIIAAGFTLVGFGLGAVFTSCMAQVIKANPTQVGTALSFTGSAMSLSMAFTTLLIRLYVQISGCDNDTCWPQYVRFLGIVSAAVIIPLTFVARMSVPLTEDKPGSVNSGERVARDLLDDFESVGGDQQHAAEAGNGETHNDNGDGTDEHQPTGKETTHGVLQTLRVLLRPTFWVVVVAYFCGIGSGVVFIVGEQDLFKYMGLKADPYGTIFGTLFSVINCINTLGAGAISDLCLKRRWMQRTTLLACYFIFAASLFAVIGLVVSIRPESMAMRNIFFGLVLLAGIPFGATFALFPSIVSDAYGPTNFGKYFGFVQIGSSLSLTVPSLTTYLQSHDIFNAVYFGFGGLMAVIAMVLIVFRKQFRPEYMGKGILNT